MQLLLRAMSYLMCKDYLYRFCNYLCRIFEENENIHRSAVTF